MFSIKVVQKTEACLKYMVSRKVYITMKKIDHS